MRRRDAVERLLVAVSKGGRFDPWLASLAEQVRDILEGGVECRVIAACPNCGTAEGEALGGATWEFEGGAALGLFCGQCGSLAALGPAEVPVDELVAGWVSPVAVLTAQPGTPERHAVSPTVEQVVLKPVVQLGPGAVQVHVNVPPGPVPVVQLSPTINVPASAIKVEAIIPETETELVITRDSNLLAKTIRKVQRRASK